jgi:hypothetical protein
MGTTQRTNYNGFMALPVAQKSTSSTGGGPSGEFGARNSRRAGPNHPRAGTDGIQPAAGSPGRPPPGWCRSAHARAGGGDDAGFGVHEPGIGPTGGAIPRWGGPLGHRAGERGLDQPPSVGCKLGRKESASLEVKRASFFNICWLLRMRHRPLWV